MAHIRQNYNVAVEAAVNKQVNIELYASYVYLSMSAYFDRPDVALPNTAKFMKKQSEEERDHALGLMRYQNLRGGSIVLQDVRRPEKDNWGTLLEAFESALALEKSNNEALLALHGAANEHDDVQLADFLEGEYLREQVESIEQMGKYVTTLRRLGSGVGEYIFDKEHLSSD